MTFSENDGESSRVMTYAELQCEMGESVPSSASFVVWADKVCALNLVLLGTFIFEFVLKKTWS